jgi:cysteinyl-tRNA synthetase
LIDLQSDEFTVRGIGCVILRKAAMERSFETGKRYPLSLLRGDSPGEEWQQLSPGAPVSTRQHDTADNSFWITVHELQARYAQGIDSNLPEKATNALLELDGTIWKAQEELETQEFISQARDILRDMIVLLVTHLTASPERVSACLTPLVEQMLEVRNMFRQQNKWEEADAIRESLLKARIVIEDTREGSKWHYQP